MSKIEKLNTNPYHGKSDTERIDDINKKVNELIDIILNLENEIEKIKKQKN